MKKPKRDSAYYLDRLEKDHPGVFADWNAGKYSSVSEACRVAGLKKPRTQVQVLKNAWSKSTAAERRELVNWIKATRTGGPAIAASTPSPPVAIDGHLEPWAAARIRHIADALKLTSGDISSQMGLKRTDTSIHMALARRTRIRDSSTILKLEAWLAANAKV